MDTADGYRTIKRGEETFTVVWEPQEGPQTDLITCPVFEVFFGGARGGGKTDGMLGEWAAHAGEYGDAAIGLMVRRQRTELLETIERSKEIYSPIGAQYKEIDKLWKFPNGARLRFAYLESDNDAQAYQGHSYTRVYVEEIGNFPSPDPIYKLMATLRSGKGVPVGFRASGNPGGSGHHWVKARYIDPAPLGYHIIKDIFISPYSKKEIERERVFIPSKITDNKYLGADYVANLQMSGSPELVKAWLEGDWNVVAGAYFPEFGAQHITGSFSIPQHWQRFRALDWGSYRPFVCQWWAVSDGVCTKCLGRSTCEHCHILPRDCLVLYREWYGGENNVGLKMTVEEVAEGIKSKEDSSEKFDYSVADPSIFKQDGGPSIAERFYKLGINFRPADNQRIPGWNQVRSRLVGIDGEPLIIVFSDCHNTIRTLPTLQHDNSGTSGKKMEDVDSNSDDHCADTLRYACMSRPFVRDKPAEKIIRPFNKINSGEVFQAHLRKMKQNKRWQR